jgi:hypothetical protein
MIFIEIDNELQQQYKERITSILTKYDLKQIDNYWIIKNSKYKLLENQILKEFVNIIVTNRTRRDIKFISMASKQPPLKYATVEYVDKKIEEVRYEIRESQRATIAYVDKKIDEVRYEIKESQRATIAYVDKKINTLETNILELFKIGLTPLYKKLDIDLSRVFH